MTTLAEAIVQNSQKLDTLTIAVAAVATAISNIPAGTGGVPVDLAPVIDAVNAQGKAATDAIAALAATVGTISQPS